MQTTNLYPTVISLWKIGQKRSRIKVLRKTYGPKRDEEGNGKDCITKSFIICIPHQILFGCSNQVRGALGIWHVW